MTASQLLICNSTSKVNSRYCKQPNRVRELNICNSTDRRNLIKFPGTFFYETANRSRKLHAASLFSRDSADDINVYDFHFRMSNSNRHSELSNCSDNSTIH